MQSRLSRRTAPGSAKCYGGSCCTATSGRARKENARQLAGALHHLSAQSAPAALDREDAFAAGIDPDARAVPAPGAAFDAWRLRDLPRNVDAATAAGIDHAHVVLVVAARAAHVDRRVPAGTRSPRIACFLTGRGTT